MCKEFEEFFTHFWDVATFFTSVRSMNNDDEAPPSEGRTALHSLSGVSLWAAPRTDLPGPAGRLVGAAPVVHGLLIATRGLSGLAALLLRLGGQLVGDPEDGSLGAGSG
jgi:hypothetical protein